MPQAVQRSALPIGCILANACLLLYPRELPAVGFQHQVPVPLLWQEHIVSGLAQALRHLPSQQPFIHIHSWLQGDDGFVVLLGLWQVQSQVDVLGSHNGHVLVLQELDVTGTHKAIDHKAYQPSQVLTDAPILLNIEFTSAAFGCDRSWDSSSNQPPCPRNQAAVFPNCEAAPWLALDLHTGKTRQAPYQVHSVCIVKHLSSSNDVLLNTGWTQALVVEPLHKVRQVLVVDGVNGHGAKAGLYVFAESAA